MRIRWEEHGARIENVINAYTILRTVKNVRMTPNGEQKECSEASKIYTPYQIRILSYAL
jgi:hypothetical protein